MCFSPSSLTRTGPLSEFWKSSFVDSGKERIPQTSRRKSSSTISVVIVGIEFQVAILWLDVSDVYLTLFKCRFASVKSPFLWRLKVDFNNLFCMIQIGWEFWRELTLSCVELDGQKQVGIPRIQRRTSRPIFGNFKLPYSLFAGTNFTSSHAKVILLKFVDKNIHQNDTNYCWLITIPSLEPDIKK